MFPLASGLYAKWSWLVVGSNLPDSHENAWTLEPPELSGLDSGGMIYVVLLPSQASNKGQQITYQELPLLHLSRLVSYARGCTWQFMDVIDVFVSTVKYSWVHVLQINSVTMIRCWQDKITFMNCPWFRSQHGLLTAYFIFYNAKSLSKGLS